MGGIKSKIEIEKRNAENKTGFGKSQNGAWIGKWDFKKPAAGKVYIIKLYLQGENRIISGSKNKAGIASQKKALKITWDIGR